MTDHREQDLWEAVGSKKSVAERGKWVWEPKGARVGVRAGGAFVGEATKQKVRGAGTQESLGKFRIMSLLPQKQGGL